MENATDKATNGKESRALDPAKTGAGDSTPAKVEEAAQALSKEEDALVAEQSGTEPKGGKGDAEESDQDDRDPGLVARMTAKGALSGF